MALTLRVWVRGYGCGCPRQVSFLIIYTISASAEEDSMKRIIALITLALVYSAEAKAGLYEDIGPCVLMKVRPADCATNTYCVTVVNNTDAAVAPTFSFNEEVVASQLVRDRCSNVGRVIVTANGKLQGLQDPKTKVFVPVIPKRQSASRPTEMWMYVPALQMTVAGQTYTAATKDADLKDTTINGAPAKVYAEVVQHGNVCKDQYVSVKGPKRIEFGPSCK